MPLMPSLFTNVYKPDVISCLADLSNDEVFTPPSVANKMLDMLPQELFSDPDTKFLDPACKSGVFLREIAKRLIKGLAGRFPDLQQRCDWILHHQLYGIAITELTSLLSRRSVYCSKYPNSPFSVSKFDDVQGNILYHKIEHTWENGKCKYCGISEDNSLNDAEREGMETHAYEFIHNINPKGILNMKFDVVISNPPYQLSTGQGQSQAKPIYQNFIEQAIKLNPRYLVMITPSRWMAGGMGLDSYRKKMLNDRHIRKMTDYALSTDCFPGVDIAGGVSYFLWDRDFSGDCEYTYVDQGNFYTMKRRMNEYDVFVRDNRAVAIVNKIIAQGEKSISTIMSSLGPFGLGTAERGQPTKGSNTYGLLSSAGKSYIEKTKVQTGLSYINKWKVILGKATSAGSAHADSSGLRKVIATADILEPNSVCTFSYFIGGGFDTQKEAENCLSYLKTKFVRYLLLQLLSGININKDKFKFVPLQDFSKQWSDNELYTKYGLSDKEITLIESMIKPMD